MIPIDLPGDGAAFFCGSQGWQTCSRRGSRSPLTGHRPWALGAKHLQRYCLSGRAVWPPWTSPRHQPIRLFSPLISLQTSRCDPGPSCWPQSCSLGGTSVARKEGRGHRHGYFPPFIFVSPQADKMVLEFSGIHFSLNSAPIFVSLASHCDEFYCKRKQFVWYTVLPMRRPGSLCSFLWLFIRSRGLMGQEQSKPPECFPTPPQVPRCPGLAVRSPAVGSVH